MMNTITAKEITDFMSRWYHAVSHGATGSEQAQFFMFPDARIYMPNGDSYTLDEHAILHQRFKDENHYLDTPVITVINNNPLRVQVTCQVAWEARLKEAPSDSPKIKTAEQESWIFEKKNHQLYFVLYRLLSFFILPGSAPLEL